MKLVLHILWFIVSAIMTGYALNLINIARFFGIKHDYIVPIILLTIGIASAVASVYLYVR